MYSCIIRNKYKTHKQHLKSFFFLINPFQLSNNNNKDWRFFLLKMALFLLSLAVGYCGSETEGLLTRPLTLATSAVTGSCRRLPKPNKKTAPERDNKRENGGFFIKTSGKATAMLIWLLNVPLKRCLPDGYHR